MKLATYKDGSRDGQLVVVSRDLAAAHYAAGIATRLQQALDDWNFISPQLQDLYETLNAGRARHAFAFDAKQCMAPLPRALPVGRRLGLHQSRRAGAQGARRRDAGELLHRPADVPGRQRRLSRPGDDIVCASEDFGIDFEGEIAVVTGDVRDGHRARRALEGIRLLMLANDVSLRNLIPGRAGEGLRLLPEQAGHRVQPGGRDARRARRRLARRPRAPHAAKPLERPAASAVARPAPR